jgi:hypothetical protein
LQHRDDGLPLGLHLDGVVESAHAHVGAAADQRLQGTGAALDIGNLRIDPALFEIAEAFGYREREIKDCGLAADNEPDLRFRRPILRARAVHQQRERGGDRNAQQGGPRSCRKSRNHQPCSSVSCPVRIRLPGLACIVARSNYHALRSRGGHRPVGWASRPLAPDTSLEVAGAMPTRSAFRVGKIAVDAEYACSASYSAFRFAALMIGHHFAISAR